MVAVTRDQCLRIRDWSEKFLRKKTRTNKKGNPVRGRLDYVPLPVKLDDLEYIALATGEDGAAHLGVWMVLLELAGSLDARDGFLRRASGRPMAVQEISSITRLPLVAIERGIEALVAIGWLLRAEVPEDAAPTIQNGSERCGIVPPRDGDETSVDGGELERRDEGAAVSQNRLRRPLVRRQGPEWERAVAAMNLMRFDDAAVKAVRDDFMAIDDPAVYRVVSDAAGKPSGFYTKGPMAWVQGTLAQMQREQEQPHAE